MKCQSAKIRIPLRKWEIVIAFYDSICEFSSCRIASSSSINTYCEPVIPTLLFVIHISNVLECTQIADDAKMRLIRHLSRNKCDAHGCCHRKWNYILINAAVTLSRGKKIDPSRSRWRFVRTISPPRASKCRNRENCKANFHGCHHGCFPPTAACRTRKKKRERERALIDRCTKVKPILNFSFLQSVVKSTVGTINMSATHKSN